MKTISATRMLRTFSSDFIPGPPALLATADYRAALKLDPTDHDSRFALTRLGAKPLVLDRARKSAIPCLYRCRGEIGMVVEDYRTLGCSIARRVVFRRRSSFRPPIVRYVTERRCVGIGSSI